MNILGSGRKARKSNIRKAPALYYNSRSARLKPEKKQINYARVFFISKYILPLVFLIYVFYFSPFFKIKEIIISGNQFVQIEDIKNEISSANIFSLNSKNTAEIIKNKIPEIRNIQIYKGIPNAVKIIVEEYQGAFVWQSAEKYFLVSENGVVFQEITADKDQYISLPRVQDLRSLPVVIGNRIVTIQFVSFVRDIFKNIKVDTNLDPDYFTIDETTVDLTLYTKNGFFIKYDTLRNLNTQTDNLKLVLVERKPEIKEYVDLRVNGWVYYK